MARPLVATYSIAACDLEAGQWGVATQSKFLARRLGRPVGGAGRRRDRDAGLREPALRAGGARAPARGPERRGGRRAADRRRRGRDHRQLGVVDAPGPGRELHRRGVHGLGGRPNRRRYAAQGNILVSAETVDAIAETFESGEGTLAERLLDCLDAAQAAGGDRRGQQSAALSWSSATAATRASPTTSSISGSTTTSARSRSCAASSSCTRRSSARRQRRSGSASTTSSPTELRERLARLGYDGELGEAFVRWTGNENLEERVDGIAADRPGRAG